MTGTREVLVRAVVVSWNGAHLLPACLDSLLAQDLAPGAMEVVVVDNASVDGTLELLSRAYPQVRVVVSDVNLGFAGGVALGLAGLDARYALLLNNDATMEPDAVRRLVEHLDVPAHARVGAATAQILLTEPDDDGRTLVNSTGNVLTRTGAATDRDWLAAAEALEAEQDVFGFCGGAALLRARALDEVGSFDPGLFLYYEDTDLSWRLRAAGWDIHYVPGAVAHHQHAASSDAASPLFRYYNTRNSLIVFTRHAPLLVVVKSFARQVLAWVRYAAGRGEPAPLLNARRRALGDYVRRLPTTLRRAIYRSGLHPRA